MRIAFAMINCNRRDGSARPVNEVAERLARRGHDVHLYARRAEDIDLSRIHWRKIPGPAWPEVANFWTYYQLVNRALAREKFDIVHSIGCNTIHANVVTIQNIQPAKEIALAKFDAGENVSAARRFTRFLYRKVTSRAEQRLYSARPGRALPLFLPVSRGVERELRAHYHIGQAPVRLIPNAADTSVFHPVSPSERAQWRHDNGFAENDFVAIFCGGEWVRKGLDTALEAIAHTPDPRIKLFIAGDDSEKPRYLARAAALGISQRVVFGGFRRDVAPALAACDVFLFPSHYEAFSLATIEAAACGLPILANEINGTEDFVQPGLTGEFLPREPEAIARLLESFAAQPEKRLVMGANARKLVAREYTWDHIADLTEQAYAWFADHQTRSPSPSIAWFATKGTGTNEAFRLRELLSRVSPANELHFNKSSKLSSLRALLDGLEAERPSLVVMEGTGIAGGLPCLLARMLFGIRYVVSSGDAVGPFARAHHPVLGIAFEIYERLLCGFSAGFIGWTPYLAGRALAFGAPRAMTAPGWTLGGAASTAREPHARKDALLVGLVGSLDWAPRQQWCYGMDLVRAARRLIRTDLHVVIIGAGSGVEHLKRAAGPLLDVRIFIPGPVALSEVVSTMSEFDVASLPQSVDGVGSYRYTTKLPEYAAAGLPIITNQTPMSYDLGAGWMWRLPGDAPWKEEYLDALTELLETLTPDLIAEKRAHIPKLDALFDREAQIERVTGFINDILLSMKPEAHAPSKS